MVRLYKICVEKAHGDCILWESGWKDLLKWVEIDHAGTVRAVGLNLA